MSDIDTFERLRRVHKNDQQFAQIALLPAEDDEYGLCIPDIDNHDPTRLLYRRRQEDTANKTTPLLDFASSEQESRVADAICQLVMLYEDTDPDEYMVLPTTQFDTYTERFAIDAVFVVLGSAKGIRVAHADEVHQLTHQIEGANTASGAKHERVYQLYATNPIDTFIGPTLLTGEKRTSNTVSAMSYTNEGVQIASAHHVPASEIGLVFRPSLVVGSDGKYF
jgi:hypothetical protein